MSSVTVELTGDEAKAFRAFQKLEASVDDVTKSLREMQRMGRQSGDEMDRANRKAFDSSAVSMIRSYTTGLTSVAGAVGLITAAWREADQARAVFAQNVRASELGLAPLGQLAQGDPAKFAQLTSAARELYRQGGAPSLQAAGESIFAFESAGVFNQRKLLGGLYPTVTDTAGFAQSAVALQAALGAGETGSFRDLLSKAFAASAAAPSTAPELLQAAASAGQPAKLLGIGDEELLAFTTVLSRSLGGAAEGGTAASSLFTALGKQGGFKGLGVLGLADALGSRNMSDDALLNFLGRKEAFTAYGIIADPENRALFQDLVSSVSSAPADDVVGQIIRSAGRQPAIAAARRSRRAAAALELAGEPAGIDELNESAQIDQGIAALRDRGVSFTSTSALQRLVRFGSGVRRALGGEGREFFDAGSGASETQAAARDMREAAVAMQEAATALNAAGRGPALIPANEDR